MSSSRKRDTVSFSYTLDDNAIARVSVIDDLGVYMNPAFNLNHHVIAITNAYFKVYGAYTRDTRNISYSLCFLRLFCLLVRSRIECASVV